jgi:hypothetical protein
VVTLATIQVDTPQGLGINTETNGAFGEAGDVVELEALARFTLVRAAPFTVVVVEVHGARAQGQFAVLDETGSACLLGENPSATARARLDLYMFCSSTF